MKFEFTIWCKKPLIMGIKDYGVEVLSIANVYFSRNNEEYKWDFYNAQWLSYDEIKDDSIFYPEILNYV